MTLVKFTFDILISFLVNSSSFFCHPAPLLNKKNYTISARVVLIKIIFHFFTLLLPSGTYFVRDPRTTFMELLYRIILNCQEFKNPCELQIKSEPFLKASPN